MREAFGENEKFEKFVSQDFNDIAKWLNSLNAYEFTLIATGIGVIIAKGLTINQQNSVGNFFEQVGQTLLTIGAQNQTVKHDRRRKPGIKKGIDKSLEEEIKELKEEVIQLRKDSLNNNNTERL